MLTTERYCFEKKSVVSRKRKQKEKKAKREGLEFAVSGCPELS